MKLVTKTVLISGVLLIFSSIIVHRCRTVIRLGQVGEVRVDFDEKNVMFLSVRNDCKCMGDHWKLGASGACSVCAIYYAGA